MIEFKNLVYKDMFIGGINIKNVPTKPGRTSPGITSGTREKIWDLLSTAQSRKMKEIDFSTDIYGIQERRGRNNG